MHERSVSADNEQGNSAGAADLRTQPAARAVRRHGERVVAPLLDGAEEATKQEIIDALKPLYFARSITFDYTTFRYSVNFAGKEIKDQSRAFLSQKPYLMGLYLTKSHMFRQIDE